MSGAVVSTAGRVQTPASDRDPRKVLIAEIRRVIRDPASTDDQVEDALTALTELRQED